MITLLEHKNIGNEPYFTVCSCPSGPCQAYSASGLTACTGCYDCIMFIGKHGEQSNKEGIAALLLSEQCRLLVLEKRFNNDGEDKLEKKVQHDIEVLDKIEALIQELQ